MTEQTKIIGWKGFDQDMKCRGFQFEVGKTYKHDGNLSLCNSGFHFCENPLDVLKYYQPATSKYAQVEAENVIDTKDSDTKRVCGSIKIAASVNLSAVIKAGVAWLIDSAKSNVKATSGNSSPAATSGYSSHAATSGDSSHAATSGDSSHAATSGNYSHAATSGNSSPAATSGDSSHAATSGDSSHAATSGNYSPAATSGYSSHAATVGKNSIAASIGRHSRAKSSLGNWIVLAEYAENGDVKTVKTAKIDGKKLKPDIFYKLVNGKFVEAK